MTSHKSQRVTSLDYAILGLVQKTPLSGYQIRKEFENTALGNYSSSPGSIYPALKRLQKLGLITSIEDDKTTKNKLLCTSDGKALLKEWFLQPIEKRDVTHKLDELLLRFGFMDDILSIDQKLAFLNSLRIEIKNYLDELLEYYTSPVFKEIHLQGRLAFEHGVDSYKATLKWCKKSISTLKKTD